MTTSLLAVWTSTSIPKGRLLLRVLLEVQSAIRHRDKHETYPGTLNSKSVIFAQALQLVVVPALAGTMHDRLDDFNR